MHDESVSLREYVEALRAADQQAITAALAAQERAVAAALAAAEKAVLKAEAAADRRFEGVNEFRQTLTDQAATFATREKVDALEARMNRSEGARTGVTSTQALVFQLVTMLIAATGLYLALSR